jgi:hypothetical protein
MRVLTFLATVALCVECVALAWLLFNLARSLRVTCQPITVGDELYLGGC